MQLPCAMLRETSVLASGAEGQLEVKSLCSLEVVDDLEEIARLRVATRTQHAHQALRGPFCAATKLLESDRRVDVVAKYCLPSVDIPREKALDTFTQELLPVLAIRSKARLHRFLEFSRQRHLTSPVPCASCSPPIARARQRCPCPGASSSRQQAGSRWCCHTCRNRPDIQARNRCGTR